MSDLQISSPNGPVRATNAGTLLSGTEFDELKVCPSCGDGLFYGASAVRMEDTTQLSMVTDIDSGEKIEGEIRAKVCLRCGFQAAELNTYAYAGF